MCTKSIVETDHTVVLGDAPPSVRSTLVKSQRSRSMFNYLQNVSFMLFGFYIQSTAGVWFD